MRQSWIKRQAEACDIALSESDDDREDGRSAAAAKRQTHALAQVRA